MSDRMPKLASEVELAHDQVFLPSKRKWGLLLMGSFIFLGIGLLMIGSSDSSWDRFWGYASTVFFGTGAVVAALQFLPGSSFLHVGPGGITFRSMWRTTSLRWSDIERFGVAEVAISHGKRQHIVGFNFSPTYMGRSEGGKIRRLNVRLSGFEAALPDNYGWDYAELAEYLNRARGKYLA